MKIGSKIQALLDKNKMSRKELGEKLGELLERNPFDAKSVGNWIIERNEPSLEIVNAMCKLFNITSGYFFEENNEELKGEKLNSALIDKIIIDLISEGVLTQDKGIEDLDPTKKNILIAALNDHIHNIAKVSK